MEFIKKIKKSLGLFSSNDMVKELTNKGAKIGKNCFIYNTKRTLIDLTSAEFIEIGDNVNITEGCIILAHDYSYIVAANVYNDFLRPQKKTKIGNNVFLGMNTIVLMGANIGDNVIVGAGSVVSGNLESNSVYAGSPAKKICTLEDYKNKLIDNFESSAICYIETKEINNIEDMKIYKTLFLDDESVKKYLEKLNLKCVNKTAIENYNSSQKKYSTYEEFYKSKK